MTTYLNRWISGYILGTDDAGQDLKAQYPLREARIDVFDVPGKPGAYRAVAFLRPHFQLEELTASIRLVAELPPPAAA
jgi:type VI secretion system protein ImpC